MLAGCGRRQQVIRSGTVGADSQVGDVLLRNVHIENPTGTRYPGNGDGDATVRLTIVNQASRPDAFTAVTTDVATRVVMLADTDCDGTPETLPRLELPARVDRPSPANAPGPTRADYVLRLLGRLPVLLVIAVAAAVLGDTVGYEVGRRAGRPLQHSRVGRRIGAERWNRAEQFVLRRGGPAVLLGRWVGVLRALVPALAGMTRMPYRRFLAWNLAGGVTWATTVVLVGYAAGAGWRTAAHDLGRASLVLALVAAPVVADPPPPAVARLSPAALRPRPTTARRTPTAERDEGRQRIGVPPGERTSAQPARCGNRRRDAGGARSCGCHARRQRPRRRPHRTVGDRHRPGPVAAVSRS